MRDKKQNTYKYRIIFKNRCESTGEITAKNLDEVYDILCKNKFNQIANNTKAFYWNRDEINTMEVELLEKGN